jgi:hypothetical protein
MFTTREITLYFSMYKSIQIVKFQKGSIIKIALDHSQDGPYKDRNEVKSCNFEFTEKYKCQTLNINKNFDNFKWNHILVWWSVNWVITPKSIIHSDFLKVWKLRQFNNNRYSLVLCGSVGKYLCWPPLTVYNVDFWNKMVWKV